MRPSHGCPENFRDSLTTPTATIPNIFHGLLIDPLNVPTKFELTSVALPVAHIIGGTHKI